MDDIYAKPWKKIAEGWARLDIGNHPSPFDIQVYRQFMLEAIENVTRPRVLLFGATPEIRDMIARQPDIELTILDINPEMIRAMSSLMVEKPVNEKQLVGDWLDTPLARGHYDAVLGDQIRSNVSYEDQETLYEQIHDLLKPTGYHISRITTRFSSTPIYTPWELVAKYSQIKPNKKSISEFWNLLAFQSHHHLVSSTDHVFGVVKEFINLPYMSEYQRIFEEILPKGKKWNIGRPWEEDKKPIEKYFEILDKVQDDTFFRDSTFIFKMRPKASLQHDQRFPP